MTSKTWDQPLISVDVIAVKLDKADGNLKAFVARRANEPFKGEFALPGVLLSPHERITEASYRALEDKVKIPNDQVRTLRDIGVSDNPDRDPRGATLSIVNLAIVDNDYVSDDEDVKLLTVAEMEEAQLPFDHSNLIRKALVQLEALLMNDKGVSKALLGEEFRTTELYGIYSQLNSLIPDIARVPDLSNLSRSLKSTSGITSKPSESLTASNSTGRGRPSSVWTWDAN